MSDIWKEANNITLMLWLIPNLGKNPITHGIYRKTYPFESQGKPVIWFIAKEEYNGLKVKATVKIEKLPENCQNEISDTFQIQFNPGTPIELEDYGNISFSQEKLRLDNVVSRLKEYKDGFALFIISFDETDSKQQIKTRITGISNYLLQKHKLPKEKFNFVIGGPNGNRTMVYLAPPNSGFEKLDWEESLDDLKLKK